MQKPMNWLKAKALAAQDAGNQFRDVGVDRYQFHADFDAGHEAPQIDAETIGLERHDQGAGGIPQQRVSKDRPSPIAIGHVAEDDGADEQAGEQREDEGADAGDAELPPAR